MTYIKAEEIGLGGDLTNNQLLQQYARLTNFLGHTLGPDYEIVLHDFTDREHSIVAIANNTVSGLEIGAPLPEVERRTMRDRTSYCTTAVRRLTGRYCDRRHFSSARVMS